MKPLKDLILASHNEGKLVELKTILQPYGLNIRSAADFGLDEPPEDGSTFAENAIEKAEYVFRQTGIPSLADDSGLVIPALGGFPGIKSGRYRKNFDSLEQCFQDLNERLEGKVHDAYFECALCLYTSEGQYQIFNGRIEGQIVYPPRGLGHDGIHFDFVFQPEGYTKSMAELGRSMKNQISHRAVALRKFIEACLKST